MFPWSIAEVSRRLDAWRTGQNDFNLAAFDAGLLPIVFADGLTIENGHAPGMLVLNGKLLYSAAWL